MATAVSMTDEQQVVVSYSGVDAAGNPEPLPAGTSISVTVADTTIATATTDPSGAPNVAIVSENAPAGGQSIGQTTAAVVVTLPDGNVLNDQIGITILPSEATQLSGSVGAPTPRP